MCMYMLFNGTLNISIQKMVYKKKKLFYSIKLGSMPGACHLTKTIE